MNLAIHILLGGIIFSKISFLPLAFLLTLGNHFFLDFLPHKDYSILNIEKKNWSKASFDFFKIIIDILFGILGISFVAIFTKKIFLTFLGAAISIFPDFITLVNLIFPKKILKPFDSFHQKIHYQKKAPLFWETTIPFFLIIIFFLYFLFLLQ